MSTEPINYEAVIADLEAKKAQIDATINMLRALSGLGALGVTPPPGTSTGGSSARRIAPDAFFGKSIPEAAVAVLQNERRKMSTQALMDAMEAGGLPPSKYNTVYAILRRRENQVGDLINLQGEWGLSAWYPNHKKGPKKSATADADTQGVSQESDAETPEAEAEASNVQEIKTA